MLWLKGQPHHKIHNHEQSVLPISQRWSFSWFFLCRVVDYEPKAAVVGSFSLVFGLSSQPYLNSNIFFLKFLIKLRNSAYAPEKEELNLLLDRCGSAGIFASYFLISIFYITIISILLLFLLSLFFIFFLLVVI